MTHDSKMSGIARVRRPGLVIVALLLGLAGCGFGFGLGGSAERVTNDAVDACEKAASAQDLDAIGEDQVVPTGGGRYKVQLEVNTDGGFIHVACDYDPAKGAQVQKPEKPPEKPPEPAADEKSPDVTPAPAPAPAPAKTPAPAPAPGPAPAPAPAKPAP